MTVSWGKVFRIVRLTLTVILFCLAFLTLQHSWIHHVRDPYDTPRTPYVSVNATVIPASTTWQQTLMTIASEMVFFLRFGN